MNLDYVKGTLTFFSDSKAVIDVQGLGIGLLIPLSLSHKLPSYLEKELQLFVSTVIREDAHKQYGFFSRAERDLFERLLNISGVGPKIALALLGHLDMDSFQMALLQGNVSVVSKVPGIGKKMAERILLDMRESAHFFQKSYTHSDSSSNNILFDATSALINLGYAPIQAQKAVKSALEEQTIEDLGLLITTALQKV